jgi:hypothetical protein
MDTWFALSKGEEFARIGDTITVKRPARFTVTGSYARNPEAR